MKMKTEGRMNEIKKMMVRKNEIWRDNVEVQLMLKEVKKVKKNFKSNRRV